VARLLRAITVLCSLATGWWAAREIYLMLPAWQGETWPWVALDVGSLLLAFSLVFVVVYFVLDDAWRRLLTKKQRPPKS
jgi:hypothetical protein